MSTLYITITDNSEFISFIFPHNVVWEMVDEQVNEDGSSVIIFEWDGEEIDRIKENIAHRYDVISYQYLF